ncbi:MAG: hypothetical protein UY56_C0004G0001 [Parcubacteria group bacterium GW2011_GWA1_50_14]|nr:MAG: hypothetical protein UY56_C0004G0001 [Parcubacteria group bacterium GW2011_GWA1_50_14]
MSISEEKICQNCKSSFVIDAEDFDFYKRINMPPPTFCPECRMIRRLMFRNEHALYKRKCNAPNHSEDVISIYSQDKPFTVYDQKFWWSDNWDPMQYGRTYDFSAPFFKQFQQLWREVPLLNLSNSNAVNSDFCNVADQSKNSYMTSGSYKIENVLYSNRVYTVKDSMDLYVGFRDELCYENVNSSDCYRVLFSARSFNCMDSSFLYDCKNCSHCFGCANLRNKQYCIFNKQYSREAYSEKMKEFDLGSAKQIETLKKQFHDIYLKSIHKYATITKSVNVIGDNVDNAKNCTVCFDITEGAEDCKYIHWGGLQTKDAYDAGPGIGDVAELVYEAVDTGLQGFNVAFTNVVYGSRNMRYALFCHNCSDIFGCIGLRNKKYCILNKQYSKEEYDALVPKIIQHMNKTPYVGENNRKYGYGEFFPAELAPFAYNESIAQDYFPLTKEEAIRKEYQWKEQEERRYVITKKSSDLPDNIKEVEDSILDDVIGCMHEGKCACPCTIASKFVPQELQFYRKIGLPLPRLCPNCRHYQRLKQRNPLKLWHRHCQCAGKTSDKRLDRPEPLTVEGQQATGYKYENTAEHSHKEEHCRNEFETTFAPERHEIVYCEPCYQSEVV